MNKSAKSGRRGARPARREERAYRVYVSDEQRSPAGCIGGQTGTLIHFQVLSLSRAPVSRIRSYTANRDCYQSL